ncbi:MAG: polysaccharide biosynthesis tyrosine autokinase [Sphingomonadales bacterium]|nr:polysaccharide biosynthesis tyrosine autokinase [Sphingomonadales bacterium]
MANFAGGGAVNAGQASSFDIAEYLRTIVKWKNFVIASIIACVLLALLYSYTRTPLYSATSQLIMNDSTQLLPRKGESAPIMVNNSQFISTQLGLIKSDSQAKRVVTRARLAQNPAYANQAGNAKKRADQAASRVRSQLNVENVRDSRLINITITSPSAAVSANLANIYAEEFIASNLDRSFQRTSYSREFLEKQLESTRQKLEDSERQLVGYASEQRIIELGADKDGNASRSLDANNLVRLNDALADARVERISAAQDMKAGNAGMQNAVDGSSVLALRTQKAQLEAEYQQKSAIFLPDYPEMKALREQIRSLERAINGEQSSSKSTQGDALRAAYRAAVDKENELVSKVDALKQDLLKLRNRSIEYTILQREVDTNRVLYEGLLQKYKEVGVSDGVGQNDVAIVDKAQAPGGPISPNIPLNLLMGLMGGVILGLGGAFLIEFVGDSINLPEEVERKLHLSLLGVMPSTDKGLRISDEAIDPKSEVAEAAYSLRTALQFTTTHGAPRSILLTSSRPAEGKSSVSFALALAFARQGKKVLLVDADMRRPTFYPNLESRDDEAGLSNVLTGQLEGDLPVRKTGIANMWLMTAGPTVPNPADLLSTNAYAEMLARALTKFDIVIADGPPVLGLADALLLGAQNEAVIMIVEASTIRRSQVLNAVNRLRSANLHIVGAVLNRFDRKNGGYGYGYSYDYDEKSSDSADSDRRIVLNAKN